MDQSDKSIIWFAVINGYAASEKASRSWEKVRSMMQSAGLTFHGCSTGKAGNAMQITFDACMAGYRRFIAVGGDGTVHDVLNGIASYIEWKGQGSQSVKFSDFTIGVIPLGSGNDWIKSTGVPSDIRKAVDVLNRENVKKQDVVKATIFEPCASTEDKILSVSYMINVGGVGLDARVCERVNAQKRQGKRGKILYVTSLLYAISHRKPARAKVVCDGKTIFDGSYLSMAFGVGKYSGGGMRQTPEAILDDGLLDITIIPDLALSRIACEVPRLFTGTFLKVPELIHSKHKTITVMPDGAACLEPVEVDGEVIGKAPVRFEVMDSQINVVVSE